MENPLKTGKKILEIIKKNFKILLRSHSSALVILLGPFLIILLIGTAFNTTSLHNIRVGIYAPEESSLIDEITTRMIENDFTVLSAATEEDCANLVKSGGAHLCMAFSGSLSKEALTREITFHVDYSKINLVFTILNVITGEVEELSTDLSVEYTRLLLEEMKKTADTIKEKEGELLILKENAAVMKESLELLVMEIEAISLGDQQAELAEVQQYITESKEQIEQFGTITTETTTSGEELLSGLDSFLTGFEEELDNQISSVEEFEATVDEYAVLACSFDFSTVEGLTFDPCTELTNIQTTLQNAVTGAEEVKSEFAGIKEQLADVQDQLEMAQEQQQSILDAASNNLVSLENNLAANAAEMDAVTEKKNAIVADLNTMIAALDENIQTIDAFIGSIDTISMGLAGGELHDPESIVNPILTRIKPVLEKKSYLDYTMPALVVLVVMFMSILLSSTVVMTEKQSRAYFRNYITPVSDILFLFSTYLTNLIIVFFQAFVLLMIAQLVFHVALFSHFFSIIFALVLISSIFILMGMCIGYLFISEETATLASISLASIFLLFSSFLVPLESLSRTVAAVAGYNPFVLAENVLRQLIIFGNPLQMAMNDLTTLGAYVVILCVLLYVCAVIDKRRIH